MHLEEPQSIKEKDLISLRGEVVIPATEYNLYGHQLHICCALGCCCNELVSLITDMPACLSSFSHCSCCCLSVQASFCKVSQAEDELGLHACICSDVRCAQIVPLACLRLTCHQCCLDVRLSVPREADSEVPCATAACGLLCCYDGQRRLECCTTVDALRAKGLGRVTPKPHPSSAHQEEARDSEHAGEHHHHKHHHHHHHHQKSDRHKHHHKNISKRRSSFTSAHSGKHHKIKVASHLDDFFPFCALGCCVQSTLLECPDACGWSAFMGCCCCRQEHLCCKPSIRLNADPASDSSFGGELCLLCEARHSVMCPDKWWSCVSHCCCMDSRCVFPVDTQTVPCLFNVCFLNFCRDGHVSCRETWTHPIGQVL